MTADELKTFVAVLREAGVQSYKGQTPSSDHVEVVLGPLPRAPVVGEKADSVPAEPPKRGPDGLTADEQTLMYGQVFEE